MKCRYLIPLVIVALVLLGACAAPAPETVTFADENLDAAIREALGKPSGEDLTAAELSKLTELGASGVGITDLSGIEYCMNLRELWLRDNQVSDLSPFSGLTNLQYLILDQNRISDISPLVENSGLRGQASLHEWDEVFLEGNPLSNTSVNVYIPQLEERGVFVHY